MPSLRYATAQDAPLITSHRHRMFADNAFDSEPVLSAADIQFEPWVRQRLEDGRYVGLLLEDAGGNVIAGAGVFFADFPPHWMDPQPLRAYVLNVYTEPEDRGQGHARLLMAAVMDVCRTRSVPTVVLHASPQGQHLYKDLGFTSTNEMIFRLNAPPAPAT
ncbi:MAG: GNAT family N-acetyltransferase [Acidobacteriaceae bacterium]